MERRVKGEERRERIPAETAAHPTQSQRPSYGCVAAQGAPGEDEVGREWFAGREGGEEDQGCGAEVVEELEGDDLGEEAEGGEGC